MDVAALAPDQPSLTAAAKLLPARHWTALGRSTEHGAVWGACQGSGANPYRVVAAADGSGYRCTCPSRKQPCKHTLALLWNHAEHLDRYPTAVPPDWVHEWLGRRRRTDVAPDPARGPKDLELARAVGRDDASGAGPEGGSEAARQRAAATREATRAAIRGGLDDLDTWLADQLRVGLATLLDEAVPRCRAIAARLVDAKATGLASRADELPARLLTTPTELRPMALAAELGRWVLLAAAWRGDPDDPDAAAQLTRAPSRAAVLADPRAVRRRGRWRVLGCRVEARRDGLISQATWLAAEPDAEGDGGADDPGATGARPAPGFALLQDYVPGGARRPAPPFPDGAILDAELAYHPSRYPLRAVIAEGGEPVDPARRPARGPAGPDDAADPLRAYRDHLTRIPWATVTPLRLGPGRLLRRPSGQLWWSGRDAATAALPVVTMPRADLIAAVPLDGAVGLWDGQRLDLLHLDTPYGPVTVDA